MHLMKLYGLGLILMLVSCGTHETKKTPVVSSDGVTIAYESYGEGSPALVFVHGWSNDRTVWDNQVARFSPKYRVVTLDLAGFGESGYNRRNWSMEMFAQDVKAVVDSLKLQEMILIGFSMGTSVAIETANLLPEKVIGVVLVDQLHDPEAKFPPPVQAYIDSLFMDIVNNPSIEKMMGPFFRNNPEESYRHVLAMIEGNPKIGWSESLYSFHQWRNDKCIDALSALECPVAAINTDQEETNVEAFQRYTPEFKADIISGTGHLVMWDASERFNRILDSNIQYFIDPAFSEK